MPSFFSDQSSSFQIIFFCSLLKQNIKTMAEMSFLILNARIKENSRPVHTLLAIFLSISLLANVFCIKKNEIISEKSFFVNIIMSIILTRLLFPARCFMGLVSMHYGIRVFIETHSNTSWNNVRFLFQKSKHWSLEVYYFISYRRPLIIGRRL